jgi:hypothetical protein
VIHTDCNGPVDKHEESDTDEKDDNSIELNEF